MKDGGRRRQLDRRATLMRRVWHERGGSGSDADGEVKRRGWSDAVVREETVAQLSALPRLCPPPRLSLPLTSAHLTTRT